jgi:predicted transcriptional regulator
MKTVGRPVEKKDRKKIGLSIDGKTDRLLADLAKKTGKTKSRLFEEAILELKKREDILEARMKAILSDEKGALLDLNKLLDDADEIDKIKETGLTKAVV